MKKLLFLMTLVICAFGVSAQNTKVITGAVIDQNGNPLPNALVEATGGAESVTTDADGSFRIEVPIWLKSLTAKYGGLQDKKIKLKQNNQIIFEMKPKTSAWFIDAAYSINIGEDITFSRAGLMGGYLGNWGGYARVMLPFGGGIDDYTPSVTAGVIKQISKPLYLYLGAGYTPVFDCWGWYSSYSGYYEYAESESGGMFEAGAILKFGKFNFSVGYSFSSSFCCNTNHSIQITAGYCF
jgi:hypothetical protein